MANATFISKLDGLVEEARGSHGISLVFCEIFGKRWSHVSGNDDCMCFPCKEIINEHWGIMHTGDLPPVLRKRIEALLCHPE